MCAERIDKLIQIPKPEHWHTDQLPAEKFRSPSLEREWKIKRLQKAYGLSRDVAERMVDELLVSN
jgi:hypothetical protein